ncbi:hypothetical protein CEXT_517101 [Caerostris extrusa]|uniref:Uncharacterized protein n=1 Tax=Caerostris extrusa TaxID=172846 RepID=A0AAV4XCQ4_CAEEX|nr:hypothetical protein CEXT_517101 [Caerostris extrusa]
MDGLKITHGKKSTMVFIVFLYWVKKGKEDDDEVEEEGEKKMVEVGGGFVFRKRTGSFQQNGRRLNAEKGGLRMNYV